MQLWGGPLHLMQQDQEGNGMREPFAVELYRRYLVGETVEQLSVALGIAPDRIRQRISAAAAFLMRRAERAA